MKTALITGITGQDGSYLAEFLLSKKYKVIGMVSKKYNIGWENIEHLKKKIIFETGDLIDKNSLKKIFRKYKLNEVYNLAGLSFIPTCWEKPQLAFDINALGVLRLLEIIKQVSPNTRFYQASSAKMFGSPKKFPQNENTQIVPNDPYGISKAAAHYLVINLRRDYKLFCVSGILYNHESPRRGVDFVSRKITLGAARIKLGIARDLRLGDLKATQDWGWAPDYVEAMWLMLQQRNPQDFIIASGKLHKVEDICKIAFTTLGLNYRKYIVRDTMFYRPQKAAKLCGDFSKAKKLLNWKPKVSFAQMIKLMTLNDYNNIKNSIS